MRPKARVMDILRCLLLLLLLQAWVPGARAWGLGRGPEIVLASPSGGPGVEPRVGEEVEIRLLAVEEGGKPIRLWAIHRPGSLLEKEEELAFSFSEARWRPRRAGLVRLELRRGAEILASRDLAVRYGSRPRGALPLLIFAAGLLFGGGALGLRAHLRGDP